MRQPIQTKDILYILGITSSVVSNMYNSYIAREQVEKFQQSLENMHKEYASLSSEFLIAQKQFSFEVDSLKSQLKNEKELIQLKLENAQALTNQKIQNSMFPFNPDSMFYHKANNSWSGFIFENAPIILLGVIGIAGTMYLYYYHIKPVTDIKDSLVSYFTRPSEINSSEVSGMENSIDSIAANMQVNINSQNVEDMIEEIPRSFTPTSLNMSSVIAFQEEFGETIAIGTESIVNPITGFEERAVCINGRVFLASLHEANIPAADNSVSLLPIENPTLNVNERVISDPELIENLNKSIADFFG